MVHRRIEPEDLAHMLRDKRMSHAQIAQETGLTISGVKQAVARYGLAKPRLSHKEALPWRLAEEHSDGGVPKYLRDLSSVGQLKKIPRDQAVTAIRWAQRIVGTEKDLDYDRALPPEESVHVRGGFYLKPAEPEAWHLKKLLDRAQRGFLKLY